MDAAYKTKTKLGTEVIIFGTLDDFIFGAYQGEDRWIPCSWYTKPPLAGRYSEQAPCSLDLVSNDT